MERTNPYAPPNSEVFGQKQARFGRLLTYGLVIPATVSLFAWCIQWLAKFPVGTGGNSLTALGVTIGTLGEVVAVPIALAKLLRNRHLRIRTNLLITVLGVVVSLPALFVIVVFFMTL